MRSALFLRRRRARRDAAQHLQRHDDRHHRPRRPSGHRRLPDHPVVAGHRRRLRPRRVRLRLGRRQPRHQRRDQADDTRSPPAPPAPSTSGSATRAARTPRRAPRAATRPARRSPRRRSRTSRSTATSSSSGLHYPIKANALSNPNPQDPSTHTCDPTQGRPRHSGATASIVFVYTDPQHAARHLHAHAQRAPAGPRRRHQRAAPPAATAPSRSAGAPPAAGSSNQPTFFQILCADDCGNPIQRHAQQADLLGLRRTASCRAATSPRAARARRASTAASPSRPTWRRSRSQTNLGDRLPPARPQVTSCPADMGPSAFADGGTFGPGSMNAYALLDPRYICSDQIAPSDGSRAHRRAHQRPDLSLRRPRRSTPSATPRSSGDIDRRRRSRPRICGAATATPAAAPAAASSPPPPSAPTRTAGSTCCATSATQVLLAARQRPLVRRLVLRAQPARRRLDRRARLGARPDAHRARALHRRAPGSGSTCRRCRRRSSCLVLFALLLRKRIRRFARSRAA